MPDNEKMMIVGGMPLEGDVRVSGGKNTSVAVIPAILLCDEPCTIENLPDIDDVHALIDILRHLGATVTYEPGQFLTVDPRAVTETQVGFRDAQRLRASYYFMGALLGRSGKFSVAYPGGCEIGCRPIDQHIKAFRALGTEIEEKAGTVNAQVDHLVGGDVFFDMVTLSSAAR